MGARRNIKLKYEEDKDIYFYTHWGAEDLEETLKQALIRGKNRWNDSSYLARIIFSEMIKDDVMSETGFGIATFETDPEYETIEIDLEKQKVGNISFEDYIK